MSKDDIISNLNEYKRVLFEELLYISLLNPSYVVTNNQNEQLTFQMVLTQLLSQHSYLLYTFPVYYKLRSKGWYVQRPT